LGFAQTVYAKLKRCLLFPTVFNLKKGDFLGKPEKKEIYYDPTYCFQQIGNNEFHSKILTQDVWKNSSVEFLTVRDTNRYSSSYQSSLSFSPIIIHTEYPVYKIVNLKKKKGIYYYHISYSFQIFLSCNHKEKEKIFEITKDTIFIAQSYRDAAYKASENSFRSFIGDSNRVSKRIEEKFCENLHQFKGNSIQLSIQSIGTGNMKSNIKKAKEAVYTLELKHRIGSGVCVDKRGLIVTNYHVVAEEDSVLLISSSGAKIKGKVIKRNPVYDLALIECPQGNYSFLSFSKDSTFEEGESVFAIGTPFNKELSQTVTKGIISGVREFYSKKLLQIDVPVNHGNSGGPLINEMGLILGIVCSGYDPEEANSISFAIPSNIVVSNLNFN